MLDFNLQDYDIFYPYMYTGLSFSKFDEILLQNNLISVNKKSLLYSNDYWLKQDFENFIFHK